MISAFLHFHSTQKYSCKSALVAHAEFVVEFDPGLYSCQNVTLFSLVRQAGVKIVWHNKS